MRNFRIKIEYDGSDFYGFQKQPDKRTVQGELESALSRLLNEPIRITGAGRTDAGVHATGQVANFFTSKPFPAENASKIINDCLPSDLVVKKAEEVDASFHSRRMAKSRTYRYTILNRPERSARLARFAAWVAEPLKLEPMINSANMLLGEHDFTSFQASGSPTKSTFRNMIKTACRRLGELLWIVLEADSFLYQMTRIAVSALLTIGKGERPQEWMAELLAARDRRLAPPPAPAQGLCLVNVRY